MRGAGKPEAMSLPLFRQDDLTNSGVLTDRRGVELSPLPAPSRPPARRSGRSPALPYPPAGPLVVYSDSGIYVKKYPENPGKIA